MRKIKFPILIFIGVEFLGACKEGDIPVNLEPIDSYINQFVNNKKYDPRLYDPPTAPWRNIEQHNGRMKHDSILKNLSPLTNYINLEVKYDAEVKFGNKPKIGFEFIEDIKPLRKNLYLKGGSFDKEEGIVLEFLSSEDFFKKHKKIQYQEGYGGFTSFRNLYYSEDGKKAVFEMDFFKRRLNSSSSVIYAEKQIDETWTFYIEMKSIS